MMTPPALPQSTSASGCFAVGGTVSGLVAALVPYAASAHTSRAFAPEELIAFWRPDPLVVVAVLLAGWLYAHGRRTLAAVAQRAGRPAPVSTGQSVSFWLGLVTLLLALASPLDTATATLFSAHMIQHVLLVAAVPPLLLLGRPYPLMLYGLPRDWRRPVALLPHQISGLHKTGLLLTAPAVAWLLHSLALWIWHEPHLYQAAVRTEWVHVLEHASFFGTALLFWVEIVAVGTAVRARIGPAMAVIALFGIGMQGAALGAILTFHGSVLYPIYEGRSELWGITAASDQRLAGLIMWIPAGSVYVLAALMLFGRWLSPPADAAPAARHGQQRDGEGSVEAGGIAAG